MNRTLRHCVPCVAIVLALVLSSFPGAASAAPSIVPRPKEMAVQEGMLALTAVWIDPGTNAGERERTLLEQVFQTAGVPVAGEGVPARLSITPIDVPCRDSVHADALISQAYTLAIDGAGIRIEARTPLGLRYGIRSLDQLLDGPRLPYATILDWPDLPVRMLMVDPARQNENMAYYRRVIDFAARYKMNAVLCHLTDDQTSALYHEDYPELLHAHAWRPGQIRDLVAFAAERDIELVPEIESLGHSRMFTRLPDYADYLHQSNEERPDESWMGTDLPGFTNVLCPASPKAMQYLDAMYARAASTFRHPWLHIGFDEVDMTQCARCTESFGELGQDEWMSVALQQAGTAALRNAERFGVWGDMLLAHPAVMEGLVPAKTIVFDWHYGATVDESSVDFFKSRGFDVIACPALVCAPHMVLPDTHNFQNIANFSRIAREKDVLGVNTTVWVPTRYMSDVLWTGMAFAAEHAWAGSNHDEPAFHSAFAQDYFGTDGGGEFHEAWRRLTEIVWHRSEFNTACWMDEESLAAAAALAAKRDQGIRGHLGELRAVRNSLAELRPTVQRHQVEWDAIEQAAAIVEFSMEHLLAAADGVPQRTELEALDKRCVELMAVIEADWDRNRFADDPGKDGLYLAIQHLLFRFRQMHRFHGELLADSGN